jgi:endonuclease/exonuclease/phosphatase (EEP) superfamily protein YafD
LIVETETGRSGPELETDDSVPQMRPRRKGRSVCFTLLVLALAGALAGWLGNLWIAFDVFAQFSLHFWLIAGAFALGFLMPFARVLTAIVVLLAGLLVIGSLPHLGTAKPIEDIQAPAGHRIIRLMSFNSWLANGNVEALARAIERDDPDILLMFEFGPEKQALKERLRGRYGFQDDCVHLENCNIAVFSKFPIADFESHGAWEGPPMIRATFGKELGDLTVIGTHTIRFPYLRAQLTQLGELGDLVRKLSGPRIVAGDFNATPTSRTLSVFEGRSLLRRLDDFLPTWPARWQLPQLAIDHIFASEDVKSLEKVRIGGNAGSDHFPLVVRVAVPVAP